jgi:glycosyltransferase involved in cell wall biosynthesis
MNQFQQDTYIPKNQRKKILLLSDDLRMPSGIGVMSKEIVFQTAQHYNWFQVGAAIEHPEKGKLTDVSAEVNKLTGLNDSDVKILANNGYGSAELVRQIIASEKIDAVLHYTDPRQWIWLYQMEHELRQNIPLLFYHVWDNLPYPYYNASYYESCDWIGCISKQSLNIVENVWKINPPEKWQLDYIPHGINPDIYFPIDEQKHPEDFKKMKEIEKMLYPNEEDVPELTILYNNRNIRRKLPGNVILAFKEFVDKLPEEKKRKVVLLMHTQPIDINGTDLPAVAQALAPDCRILFSNNRVDSRDLNCIYNIADVTINLSNAEGFGLGTAESLMAGTPIIATVTGGLQDQFRFEDENGEWINFIPQHPSNHDGKYKKHGGWGIPLFPVVSSMTGSPMTPYIFDDHCSWKEASDAMMTIYNMSREERKQMGLKGRQWLLTEESGMNAIEMGKRFIKGIDTTFDKWVPRQRYNLFIIK